MTPLVIPDLYEPCSGYPEGSPHAGKPCYEKTAFNSGSYHARCGGTGRVLRREVTVTVTELPMTSDPTTNGYRPLHKGDTIPVAAPCRYCGADPIACDAWRTEQRKCCPDCAHDRGEGTVKSIEPKSWGSWVGYKVDSYAITLTVEPTTSRGRPVDGEELSP